MEIKYLFLLLLSFLFSCTFQSKEGKQEGKKTVPAYSDSLNINDESERYDTIIRPFKDLSCDIGIRFFDSGLYDEGKNNMVIVLKKKGQIMYSDSLNCMSLEVDRKDMDNDGVDDILIFHSTGARANPTYYLYLVSTFDCNIRKVQGFQELPNPDIDGDIITSVALVGTAYLYKFYRLKGEKLINLGKSFKTDMGDTVKYQKTIRSLKMTQ